MPDRPVAPRSRRVIAEVIALGLANGVFLGLAFMAADRTHAVLAAVGACCCITLAYLFVSASRRA